jgi:hypothetical protein
MDKPFSNPEFLDYTIKVFQPYYSHPLTREEAQGIAASMVNFFQALTELESSISSKKSATPDEKDLEVATNVAKPAPFRPR